MVDREHMKPASQVDIASEFANFVDHAEAWRFESMHSHIESMTGRMGMAYGDVSIEMLRIAGETGITKNGVTVKRLSTSNPWILCGTIAAPGGDEIGIVVEIKKPFTGRDSVDMSIQFAGWKNETIPTEGTIERAEWEASIIDRAVSAGYPADLPPADDVATFDWIGFYRFGGYSGGTAELARACVTERFYWADCLFRADRVNRYSDEEAYESIKAEAEPSGWLPAAAAFKAACEALGLAAKVTVKAREFGEVRARHYTIEDVDRSLESLGAAAALLDDGFPGETVENIFAALEGEACLRKLAPRIEDAATVIETCFALGQHDRKTAGAHSDLRLRVWATSSDRGYHLRIDDIRKLELLIEGDIHAPDRVTIWEVGEKGREKFPGEPGFLGSFSFVDGPKVLVAPTYGTEEVRAGNLVVSSLESAAIEISEYSSGPTPTP